MPEEQDREAEDQAFAIESYLEGVPFPADKEELIAHASQRGAPEEMLAMMENISDRQYTDVTDVRRELGLPAA